MGPALAHPVGGSTGENRVAIRIPDTPISAAAAVLAILAMGTGPAVGGLAGQTPPDTVPAAVAVPGSELRVFLLTMGQGDAVWEYFGHNALVIRNEATGESIAWNWGIFDFDEPGFLARFLRGTMQYWLEGYDTDATIRAYAARDRAVWSQELNLTPEQKSALDTFVRWNALPENRRYTYDYFRDNCSTRVRDALDRVLDGRLSQVLRARAGPNTYRSEALRLTAADLPISTGIDIGLGPFTDEPLTAWEEAFVPMRLRDHLREVTVTDADGREVPLVLEERVLNESSRPADRAEQPARLAPSLVVGILLALAFALIGALGARGRGMALLFGAAVALWALVNGLLGVVLAGLWVFTDHIAAWRNENLLQTSPVALLLVPLALGAVLGSERARELAGVVAVLLAGLSILGIALSPLPFFDQANAAVTALVLPSHVVIAWLLIRWSGPSPSSTFGDTTDRAWRARAARAAGRHR